MSDNKTSRAIEDANVNDITPGELRAIAAKYQKMEEALPQLVRLAHAALAGKPFRNADEAILAAESALSFDPLA